MEKLKGVHAKTIRTRFHIRHFNDLFRAMTDSHSTLETEHEIWWRGQANSTWNLRPLVYREEFLSKDPHNAGLESSIFLRFQNQAYGRYHNPPPAWDTAGWMFLARHYGLPTRLLDWSRSVLVAAFFATSAGSEQDDACLYALQPVALNASEKMDPPGLPAPMHDAAKQLFVDATLVVKKSNQILAISAAERDRRMTAQLSRFTIHGRNIPLEEVGGAYRFLVKYVIPAAAKPMIKQSLTMMGLRMENLFPDLDHLAVSLFSSYLPVPEAAALLKVSAPHLRKAKRPSKLS